MPALRPCPGLTGRVTFQHPQAMSPAQVFPSHCLPCRPSQEPKRLRAGAGVVFPGLIVLAFSCVAHLAVASENLDVDDLLEESEEADERMETRMRDRLQTTVDSTVGQLLIGPQRIREHWTDRYGLDLAVNLTQFLQYADSETLWLSNIDIGLDWEVIDSPSFGRGRLGAA